VLLLLLALPKLLPPLLPARWSGGKPVAAASAALEVRGDDFIMGCWGTSKVLRPLGPSCKLSRGLLLLLLLLLLLAGESEE